MKATAITIITAGSLLIGATAALAQGSNAGAIYTNPGAIGTKPRCYRQRQRAVSIASAFDGWPGTGLLGAQRWRISGSLGSEQSHRISLPVPRRYPVVRDRSRLLHRVLLVPRPAHPAANTARVRMSSSLTLGTLPTTKRESSAGAGSCEASASVGVLFFPENARLA